MTLWIGIPTDILMVGLIDKLCLYGKTFDNLKQQVTMIAHVLALGKLGIVIVTVGEIGAQVIQTLRSIIPISVTIQPTIHLFHVAVAVIE